MQRQLSYLPGGRSARGNCSRPPPINRARFAVISHSLARRSLRKMFKFLVLVGFVACALAEPAPEEVAPVRKARDGYWDCVADCSARAGAIVNPGAGIGCFAHCAFKRSLAADVVPSEQMKRMVDFTRPELVGGAPVEVKQCFNKCVADYGASGDNFNYCIIGCNLGGQKLVQEKEGVVPTGGRQARGYDSCYSGYCYWVQAFPPALLSCLGVCMAAGGRRRSIDYLPKDETPLALIDVDFKPQLRDRKADCLQSCASNFKLLFPGVSYLLCLRSCNTPGGRSLAGASSPPTDSASLMQITEPITNILSQVIKKQQEMLQMIQSCNCAKPLTPFGLDNGALGPYF